jgi:CRISPR-associated protein Cas2
MHLVVCYDIVDDRRRARLFKQLKGFLVPVQKSVFEGVLADRRYPALIRTIKANIDEGIDTVRVYHLCRGCVPLTELFGTSRAIDEDVPDIVV